jgi:hypothetical protein
MALHQVFIFRCSDKSPILYCQRFHKKRLQTPSIAAFSASDKSPLCLVFVRCRNHAARAKHQEDPQDFSLAPIQHHCLLVKRNVNSVLP